MIERVSIYDQDDQGDIWLSRPIRVGRGIGEEVWRIDPGDLDGLSWQELRGLPCGAELDLEFDRRLDGGVPRHARIVRALVKEPASEPARHVDAPAPQPKPEPPPEPSPRELAAEGERLAKERMRAYLVQRGITTSR